MGKKAKLYFIILINLLAWGYVGLRIIHSIWQATVNLIPIRFTLFMLATICLLGLAINAARATLGH